MAEFGVSTSNKFSFLDDDAPVPKKESKSVKKQETIPKASARPESARNERGDRTDRNNNNDRGGRGRGAGGRGRGGDRGRGRGGGRGGRGGKREFDRHVSGTGRDKSVRKEGHGKYGWGEEGDESRPRNNNRRRNEQPQEDVAEPSEDAKPETTEEETTATAANGTTEEQTPAEPVEPEDTSVTYEEFLAQKEAKKVEDDEREARAVRNDDKFQGVEITKEEFVTQIEIGTGNKAAKKTRKAPSKNKALALDEFNTTSTGRGGRGRGRGRGGNRGGGRGYRPPSLNDQHFPKLG